MGRRKVLEEDIYNGNSHAITPPWLPEGLCFLSVAGCLTHGRVGKAPLRYLRYSLIRPELCHTQKRYVEVATPVPQKVPLLGNRVLAEVIS